MVLLDTTKRTAIMHILDPVISQLYQIDSKLYLPFVACMTEIIVSLLLLVVDKDKV